MDAFRLNLAIREISSDDVPKLVHVAAASVRKELASTHVDQDQMASVTRELAKQATLGFQDALDEVRRAREAGAKGEGEGSVLWAATEAAESGDDLMWVLGILVALLLVAVLVLLWLVVRLGRQVSSQSAAAERTA
jgi:hypothetical protein